MNRPNHCAQTAVDLENLHLLVVEPELEAQAAIVSALEACGAGVMVADSVQTGLAAVDQQYPDVIISDLDLPDGNGCTLMQAMRQRDVALPMVPAIAVSACARTVDLEEVVSLGFKRHIGKPIRPTRLINMVAWLTDRVQTH